MTSKYLIYAYIDPRTEEFFYIGQSSRGLARPLCFKKHASYCLNVIKKILNIGMKPRIIVIQEFQEYDDIFQILNNAETYWISEFRRRGCPLTNLTNGGEGTHGFPSPTKGKHHSEEAKKKMSKSRLGIKPWNKGLKTKETHKEAYKKSGEKQRIRKSSEETRKKISSKLLGRVPWNKGRQIEGHKHSEEIKKKISESNKGKHVISEETRLKMKISSRRRWHPEEFMDD